MLMKDDIQRKLFWPRKKNDLNSKTFPSNINIYTLLKEFVIAVLFNAFKEKFIRISMKSTLLLQFYYPKLESKLRK